MTNVFNTLLLALCIADLLVIAANLPLAISVHTQLDMFRSAMQSTVFRVWSTILKLQDSASLGVLLKMISLETLFIYSVILRKYWQVSTAGWCCRPATRCATWPSPPRCCWHWPSRWSATTPSPRPTPTRSASPTRPGRGTVIAIIRYNLQFWHMYFHLLILTNIFANPKMEV